MFNRKGEITRERRINGPIVIIVLSLLVWTTMAAVIAVRTMRAFEHQHTAECWDD